MRRLKDKILSVGQIATILTLIIALIFVFIALTLNMRRITQKKAIIDNACDGAGLLLASNLGSLGKKLSQEYLKGDTQQCNIEWSSIGAALGTVFAAVGAIFFPPLWGVVIAGVVFLGGQTAHAVAIEPKQFENFSVYFKQMTAEQQLIEGAIQYAAFGVIDDQEEVIDMNDDDGDGFTNDKILRLTQEYYKRLRTSPSSRAAVAAVANFIAQLKIDTNANSGLVKTKDDDQTWEVEKTWIPDPLSLKEGDGSRYFTDWLKTDFVSLLRLLRESGYSIPDTMWKEGVTTPPDDDVDKLVMDITDFENWANGILKTSPDARVASLDQWSKQWLDPDAAALSNDNWLERLLEWQDKFNRIVQRLDEIQADVEICVNMCPGDVKEYDCCKYDLPKPLPDGGSEPGGCNSWGCCKAVRKTCCEGCDDGRCPPGGCCNTCCRIQPNCDRNTSLIVRALDDHLYPFLDRLSKFWNYTPVFIKEVTDFRANLKANQKFTYNWTDTLGPHTVEVSVKDFKDAAGNPVDFTGPFLDPKREWGIFQKCLLLKDYKGSFTMAIKRYDKEEASELKGILDLFKWDRTITSEAKVSYGINKADIKLERIR